MSSESYAIEVKNVVKKFRIYHKEKTIFDKIIDIVNRNASYEDLAVIDDISFKVNKGEMIGIIGKNGSGKTTLLRLIARIIRPTRGIIRTRGSIVPLLELGTGFEVDLTARDNVIQYGIILGFKKKEMKKKVEEILKFAELEKFADTKLNKFSSGMVARLAFSTAAQVEPEILLVDEVLSVGDLSFNQKSYQQFSSFKERNKTIVFVSHGLDTVRKLCDRAILLNDGKIHSTGEPEKVIDDYLGILNMPRIAVLGDSRPARTVEELRKIVNIGDFKQAIVYLKRMLDKEPTNGELNYLFAYCLHHLKMDYPQSLHHYELALKYGFHEFWVRYARGTLYLQIGDIDAATSDLKRAMSLNPSHDGPKRMLQEIAKLI